MSQGWEVRKRGGKSQIEGDLDTEWQRREEKRRSTHADKREDVSVDGGERSSGESPALSRLGGNMREQVRSVGLLDKVGEKERASTLT